MILFVCSLLSATPLQAQQSRGSISGRLTDSRGNALAQVIITLPELNRHVISDTSGSFRITGLPAGEWQLKIHSIGFLDHAQVVHVSPGLVTTLDIHLSDDVKALDGVTVAAMRKTASQNLKESGFNVNAIETRSYQNRTADLSQLLDKTTGIKVRTSGGVGSDYSFSVNGLSGKAIRYFVDGVPMDVFGSTMSLNNIPVNLAERVEVYKGVVPVQLGADAMGGAVNIVTRSDVNNYLDASYSFGSFNTHIASVTGQLVHRPSGLTVRVSAFGNYADNNYRMRDIEIWDSSKYEYVHKDFRRFHDRYRAVMGQLEAGLRLDKIK